MVGMSFSKNGLSSVAGITTYWIALIAEDFRVFPLSQSPRNRVALTSAAVALAVQLVYGRGHVAKAYFLTLFTGVANRLEVLRRRGRL